MTTYSLYSSILYSTLGLQNIVYLTFSTILTSFDILTFADFFIPTVNVRKLRLWGGARWNCCVRRKRMIDVQCRVSAVCLLYSCYRLHSADRRTACLLSLALRTVPLQSFILPPRYPSVNRLHITHLISSHLTSFHPNWMRCELVIGRSHGKLGHSTAHDPVHCDCDQSQRTHFRWSEIRSDDMIWYEMSYMNVPQWQIHNKSTKYLTIGVWAYTKLDAVCDKQETVVGRLLTTLTTCRIVKFF